MSTNPKENHGDNCPRIPVRLSPQEHADIAAAAKAVGLTMSAFLRMSAIERARASLRNL